MANDAKGFVGDDARLKKDPAMAVRGSRDDANAERENKDGTALTAEERRRLLRSEATQEILPSVPDIPGYHVCWLSTNSSTDPIFRRMKVGYTPVKVQEVRGLDFYKITGGEYDGCIQCHEMVLFKVPQETYIDLMTIYHHDMPNEEEASIKEKLQQAQMSDSGGRDLGMVEGDGFSEMGKNRQPIFN